MSSLSNAKSPLVACPTCSLPAAPFLSKSLRERLRQCHAMPALALSFLQSPTPSPPPVGGTQTSRSRQFVIDKLRKGAALCSWWSIPLPSADAHAHSHDEYLSFTSLLRVDDLTFLTIFPSITLHPRSSHWSLLPATPRSVFLWRFHSRSVSEISRA